MFRGMPIRICSTCFSVINCLRRARKSPNGSAAINSSGCASVAVSSLTAMPIRFVPWSMARMRIRVEGGQVIKLSGLESGENFARGVDGGFDFDSGVGGRDEAGFELRRRKINAFLAHSVKV